MGEIHLEELIKIFYKIKFNPTNVGISIGAVIAGAGIILQLRKWVRI